MASKKKAKKSNRRPQPADTVSWSPGRALISSRLMFELRECELSNIVRIKEVDYQTSAELADACVESIIKSSSKK